MTKYLKLELNKKGLTEKRMSASGKIRISGSGAFRAVSVRKGVELFPVFLVESQDFLYVKKGDILRIQNRDSVPFTVYVAYESDLIKG
jgi:hypothetical protein